MTKEVQVQADRLGLPSVLFVVFLVLKLTHVIGWSWLWVTAPLWISAILISIVLVVGLVAYVWLSDKFDK